MFRLKKPQIQMFPANSSEISCIAELDICQIIIFSIYVPSTYAYTHVLRLSLDLPYEKR
jgi:hypothetical protein